MKTVAVATVIGGAIAGAVSASAALNLPTQNCSYSFNSNMKLGSRGTSVMNLQKVLNAYPQTQIAASGAGSPGNETTYFGAATRSAVNKFQALHLVELGITSPTGNVFAGTRGLLNAICVGGNAGQGNNGNGGNTGGVVSGPVTAMLAASQPTGMIVQKQSGARLADFTFTGNGTVTSLQLQRVGVSTDSTLTNVYLYDGNTRISDAASVVTGGFINFNAPSGLFTVSGSRTITVRADIADLTSGQTVGVKINSVTAGGAVSTYTNVMGNSLQIGSVTPATVNFATLDTSALSPAAGTLNFVVWSGAATVSTRDVTFRAATFKFVGSAPTDSIQNLNLFVDGVKVAGPSAVNAANNNKVSFDLGSSPYLLKTGTHTIELRGDIVKGSNRTATFSVENVADLMFEDSSLPGVNVASTIGNNAAFTQSGATFGQITIQKGSVTASVDPAFTATRVTGGATNVPVGQFTLKAYGEDVKVNTLRVAIATTTNAALTSLNNVALYVNGGQVGTSQNYTAAINSTGAGYLEYNLGSSLIIPAGQTVTLTVKADIVNSSNAAYTSGTIAATIKGAAGNAQGQSSSESVTVAGGSGITSQALTVSSGVGSFARTSGFTAATVAPNTSGVKLASFTLQAGSAEGLAVSSVSVKFTETNGDITNYSNLTLKNGTTVVATPIGNPAEGTSTFSLYSNVTVPANGSVTFDVYADVGGDVNETVQTDMAVTTRGLVSNTTTISSVPGIIITSAAATLSPTALQSSSPVSQFVVGGSSFGIATFTVKTASAGTQATVSEMDFATTGTDAIQSITVGGVTKAVTGSGAAATTTFTGLSIPVGSTGTDIPVTVTFSGFQGTPSNGSLTASVASVGITLSRVLAMSGNSSPITDFTQVPSNAMTLVASKPTVTVSSGGTDSLNIGALSKIGEFTVTADANGKIAVASTSISVSTVGITNPELATSTLVLKDGGTTVPNVSLVVNAGPTASTTPVFTFTTPYQIAAGQSKTFSIYGTINGAAVSGIVPRANTSLTSGATFKWIDVAGGNSVQTGAAIYNFPSNSYTTKTQ